MTYAERSENACNRKQNIYYRKFLTNVWKFLWERIADTKGPKMLGMGTTDNIRQNSLIAPVVGRLLAGYFQDHWCP